MVSVFYKKDSINYPTHTPSIFRVLESNFNINILKHKNYYYEKEGLVNNSNTLVKMIKTFDVDVEQSIWEYIPGVDNRLESVCRLNNVVTNTFRGGVIKKPLSDGVEVYQNVSMELDIFNMENTWKETTVTKVVYTDTLNITTPHLSIKDSNDGPLVIDIDFIAMLVQFKHWALERKSLGKDVDPRVFVYQILMTNLVEDMLNWAILNMVLTGNKIEYKNNNPYDQFDLYNKTNRYIGEIRDDLKDKSFTYARGLKSIKLINTNALNLTKLNNLFPTIQNKWYNVYTRTELLLDLVMLLGDKSNRANRKALGEIELLHDEIKYNHIKHVELTTLFTLGEISLDNLKDLARMT